MNDHPLQPGDATPQDAARPGDEAKLHTEGANVREGNRAPEDHASAADQAKLNEQTQEGVDQVGGVKL